MKYWLIAIGLFVGMSAVNACAPADEAEEVSSVQSSVEDSQKERVSSQEASIQQAEKYYDSMQAVLTNTEGERVGIATFTETSDGVEIELEGWSLPPGEHGFHIHEHGQCEGPEFETAGEHFNPTDAAHGFDHPEGPHAGDLKNIEVNEEGNVQTTVLGEMISIQEDAKNSIVSEEGTSIMIHEGPDDYTSQPAGDAGKRIACGTIQ